MPTYQTSDGQRVEKSIIDRRTREGKEAALEAQRDEFGFNFCVKCNNNGNGRRLHCSHIISVKEAQETGRAELAWLLLNIQILCEVCHAEFDGLNVQLNFNK